MMIQFFAMVVVVFFQALPFTSSAQATWVSIEESDFAISHPVDWQVDRSGQMGSTFILLAAQQNDTDLFRENVNLIKQDLSGYNIDMDQYVSISEEQINTMITGSQIVQSKRMKSGGTEFHKISYTGEQGVFKLYFEQYYFIEGTTAYVLTFTAEVDQFTLYQATAEKILDTFKLK